MTDSSSRTLTFLFTDIQGSTRLLQDLAERYTELLDHQRELIGSAAERHGGRVFGTEGDAIFVAFEEALGAVLAAAEAQRAIAAHHWPDGRPLEVRMGIHTGAATRLKDDYVGLVLHATARITAAGHGGQVLVSESTAGLVRDGLDDAGLALTDLGVHRLKDLAAPERLFQLGGDGLATRFPALRTLEVHPNNLPLQLTTFVGRPEVPAARALLASSRLVTLTGPGGTGKTRLALELADEVADEFPDGVFFVALETVREPDLVPTMIAGALSLPEQVGVEPLERVVAHLRERRLLLVLDNYEQVIDAAPLVGRLLREAPALKVIVTSRIPLRVSGEQEFGVPPLLTPTPSAAVSAAEIMDSHAVRLFVERAMAANPAFRLSDALAPAVAEIVRRLDGLPLAIELAAARVRSIPVEALRARLEGALVGVLVGGARDLPLRQQTLRGAIDWSHDLLDEPDRRLFARMAVFAGGARLTEAEAICGPATELGRDVLDGLTSLADKSLLQGSLWSDEEPRFSMLATVRDYAGERLAERGEHEVVAGRHARAYLALAEAAAPHLTGPDAGLWLDRLERDHDNLRAAVDRVLARDEAELALRFVVALWRFWQVRGHLHEGWERSTRILGLAGADGVSTAIRARAVGAAGSIAYWRADLPAGARLYRRALELAREADDEAVLAEALYNHGFLPAEDATTWEQRYVLGVPAFQEARALYGRLGDRAGLAAVSWALALTAVSSGRTAEGIPLMQESLAIYRELGDVFGAGWALHLLGAAEAVTDRFDEAGAHLSESLRLFMRSRDLGGYTITIADFAVLAWRRGRTGLAWRLFGAALRLGRESGTDLLSQPVEALGWSIPTEPPADDEAAQRAFAEGSRLGADDAVALALATATGAEDVDEREGAVAAP